MNTKLPLYRRSGVKEYILWRVRRRVIEWFVLRGAEYKRLPQSGNGVIQSETFPCLWLDAPMIDGDLKQVLAVSERGISSPEHAVFVNHLAERCK